MEICVQEFQLENRTRLVPKCSDENNVFCEVLQCDLNILDARVEVCECNYLNYLIGGVIILRNRTRR